MTIRIAPKDQSLLSVVGEVLHYIWDPIGVSGAPQARDEYQGYVDQVFSMLRSGSSESEIALHLSGIARDRMELRGLEKKSAEAASVLVEWRDLLAENRA